MGGGWGGGGSRLLSDDNRMPYGLIFPKNCEMTPPLPIIEHRKIKVFLLILSYFNFHTLRILNVIL